MSKNLQVAVAIDVRVRQLALQGVSDDALADRMIGYMPGLQKLWTSATDEELAAYCRDYPGFLRHAKLMENISERMRAGTRVPAGVKQLSPFRITSSSRSNDSSLKALDLNAACKG